MKHVVNNSKKVIIRTGLVLSVVSFFLLFIYENATSPQSVIAQTISTPTGTQTNIVTSCQSFPNIPGNNLCSISNNVKTNTIPIIDPNCGNGGVAINNVCPTSVVALPAKPVTQNPVPVIPTSDPIQVIPVVSIIDDSGNINTLQTDAWSLNLNSFLGKNKLDFIATSNNVLIDKGQIKLQIQLKGRANSTLIANGTLWAYVNGVPVNPLGVKFGVGGMTNQPGSFFANISTPSGVAQGYTFDIATNLALLNKPVNILSFNMSNIQIQNEKGQKFSSVQQKQFFNIEIDNIPNMIIQKNAQGQSVRIYPSDDTFTLSSAGTVSTYYSQPSPRCGCGQYAITVTATPLETGSADVYLMQNGTIKSKIGHLDSVLGTGASFSHIATYGCNELNNACASNPSSVISNIPRDSDISIVITGGASPGTKSYHTPVTQQSYSFSCTDKSCVFSP